MTNPVNVYGNYFTLNLTPQLCQFHTPLPKSVQVNQLLENFDNFSVIPTRSTNLHQMFENIVSVQLGLKSKNPYVKTANLKKSTYFFFSELTTLQFQKLHFRP